MGTPKAQTRDLLVIGEALVGLATQDGMALRRSHSLRRLTVGAEVNVGVAASRLGRDVTWIGRVGADISGESVLDDLRHEGVNVDHAIIDAGASTGVLLRESTPLGVTRVSYARAHSAGSRLEPADILDAVVRSHRMVLVSGVTAAISPSGRDAARALFERAKFHGITAVFDMNYRSALWSREDAGPELASLAALADIVVGGETEWNIAFGNDLPSPALLPQATALIRTAGAKPVEAWAEGKHFVQEVFAAQPVDVVGAGDAFLGGVTAALLADASWQQALRQGAYCGARVVSALGDWTNLPWGEAGITPIPNDYQEVLR